jgi:hypothetical protein
LFLHGESPAIVAITPGSRSPVAGGYPN